MPIQPVLAQIKQNPRGGACGVAVKMTSPIRVLARLSGRLTVTGSGEKTLSKTRRGPRGGSQSWFAASLAPPAGLQPMSREICGFQARMMRTFARLQEITIPFRGLRRQTHPPSHPPYAGDETQPEPRTRERNAAARGEPLLRTSRRPCAFSNVPRGSRICGHTFGFSQWSWIHHASRCHCYDFRTLRTLLL